MFVVFRLETHLESEHKDSAWLLLALISAHVQMKDPEFAMNYFNESIHTEAGVNKFSIVTCYHPYSSTRLVSI